jgi:hypothetical protein
MHLWRIAYLIAFWMREKYVQKQRRFHFRRGEKCRVEYSDSIV